MGRVMLAALLGAALGGGAGAQEARGWYNPEYVPVVEPLDAILRGCLDQGYDRESYFSCHELTVRACLAMGPGGATTYGYVMCATVLRELWDEELGRTWMELRVAMPSDSEHLEAEQAAWEVYRDAACAFAVAEVAGGSMASHVGGECLVRMAAERVAEFRDLLRYQ